MRKDLHNVGGGGGLRHSTSQGHITDFKLESVMCAGVHVHVGVRR